LIFTWFAFLTLVFLALIVIGITTKHPTLVALGGLFMVLTGSIVMSEGIRDEGMPTWVREGESVSPNYATLTQVNDSSIAIIAPMFFYGGFAILLLSVGAVLWTLKQRKEDWY